MHFTVAFSLMRYRDAVCLQAMKNYPNDFHDIRMNGFACCGLYRKDAVPTNRRFRLIASIQILAFF